MTLTKDFKSTIMARAKKDKKFCEVMLSEACRFYMVSQVQKHHKATTEKSK